MEQKTDIAEIETRRVAEVETCATQAPTRIRGLARRKRWDRPKGPIPNWTHCGLHSAEISAHLTHCPLAFYELGHRVYTWLELSRSTPV